MHRFLILSAFVLGAAFTSPIGLMAQDHDQQGKTYHDKKHNDDHTWNDNEDRAYRSYLTQKHQTYRTFDTQKPAQQQAYLGWRHSHPDSVLFKLEIK